MKLRSGIIFVSLATLVTCLDRQDFIVSDRIDALTEALIDPEPAAAAYPNSRQGRANGLSAIKDAITNGGSSGIFGSIFSGLTGMFNKFSTSMGGPELPSHAMGTSFQQALQDQEKPTAGFKPPRMSKPGPEAFKKANDRKRKVKGRAKRQGLSVKTFNNFNKLNKQTFGPQANANAGGGELTQILMGLAKLFSSLGGIGSTPVSRMKTQMQGFREGAEVIANRISDAPNQVFGALRSKRQVLMMEDVNDVGNTVTELADAHQRNWFTYFRSYNGSTLECHEWDFCTNARANDGFRTPTARSGGKLISYLTAGVRDQRGKTGGRLAQAVDCCLSDDVAQADMCEDFYQRRCLEGDPDYVAPKD